MQEIYQGARLAVAKEAHCCSYAARVYLKILIAGIEHAQKSLAVSSPALRSFHRYKAIEKCSVVALQDIYPKGQRYALLVLQILHNDNLN